MMFYSVRFLDDEDSEIITPRDVTMTEENNSTSTRPNEITTQPDNNTDVLVHV